MPFLYGRNGSLTFWIGWKTVHSLESKWRGTIHNHARELLLYCPNHMHCPPQGGRCWLYEGAVELHRVQTYCIICFTHIEAELWHEQNSCKQLYKCYKHAISTIESVTTLSNAITVSSCVSVIALITTIVTRGIVSVHWLLVNWTVLMKMARKLD